MLRLGMGGVPRDLLRERESVREFGHDDRSVDIDCIYYETDTIIKHQIQIQPRRARPAAR